MLKIPTRNSCKRQNPVPRSLPLSSHWTLLTRQQLKGIPLGHSQNQPLHRLVSAFRLRNRAAKETAAHCQLNGRMSNSAPDRLKQCSLSEQQVKASQEKLSEIRPVAKLQGTEEVMLKNPLLFFFLFSFLPGKRRLELLCRPAGKATKWRKLPFSSFSSKIIACSLT